MHNVYVNQVRRSVNGPQFVEMPEKEPPGNESANGETAVDLENLQRSLDWLAPDQRETLQKQFYRGRAGKTWKYL
jgi:DNA-directed RNA polymerase specialized sigma24 family protein